MNILNLDVIDMPTPDDLRAIVRKALDTRRGVRPDAANWSEIWVRTSEDMGFAHTELSHMGRLDIWQDEQRRDELLKRGYTPPAIFSKPS